MLVLCWSCREDADVPDMSQPLYMATASEQAVVVETRSYDATVYKDFTDPSYEIGIYLAPQRVSNLGVFSYDSEKGVWVTKNARVDPDVPYEIFGFTPVSAVPQSSITGYSIDGSFGSTPKLTLSNVPAVLNKELSVIVGVGQCPAKSGGVWSDENAVSEAKKDATLGQFSFTGRSGVYKPTGDDIKDERNIAFFLMQRLFAEFDFQFKINEDYDKLRKIVVKSVTLKTNYAESVNVGVTFANGNETDPIQNVLFTPTGSSAEANLVTSESHANGLTLTTSAQSIPGFFTPTGSTAPTFSLEVTYDVYVKNPSETDESKLLVRPNCKAVNTFSGITNVARGTKYQINVEVKPTYLYQLSDKDLNNPGINITVVTP